MYDHARKEDRCRVRGYTPAVVVLACLAAGSPILAEAGSPIDVQVEDVSLGELIADINERYDYGVQLVTEAQGGLRVSGAISQASIGEVFHELLRHYDYALIHGEDRKYQLYVYGPNPGSGEASAADGSIGEPPGSYQEYISNVGPGGIVEIIPILPVSEGDARREREGTLAVGPDGLLELIPADLDEDPSSSDATIAEGVDGLVELIPNPKGPDEGLGEP
jgi:hypothetical protein